MPIFFYSWSTRITLYLDTLPLGLAYIYTAWYSLLFKQAGPPTPTQKKLSLALTLYLCLAYLKFGSSWSGPSISAKLHQNNFKQRRESVLPASGANSLLSLKKSLIFEQATRPGVSEARRQAGGTEARRKGHLRRSVISPSVGASCSVTLTVKYQENALYPTVPRLQRLPLNR
jgi:hypothetical protein